MGTSFLIPDNAACEAIDTAGRVKRWLSFFPFNGG